MREFQPTGKRHEELRIAEEGARRTLQEFLDSNYTPIRAMRAYSQHLYVGEGRASPQLESLKSFIDTESKGKLRYYDGTLCEIGYSGEEFANSHTAPYFEKGREFAKYPQAIRGFWLNFNLKETEFECVVLDDGRSRTFFDEKDKNERRRYVERFANRKRDFFPFLPVRRGFKIWKKLPLWSPLWFTAFVTDTGEKLVIEELVARRNKQRLRRT